MRTEEVYYPTAPAVDPSPTSEQKLAEPAPTSEQKLAEHIMAEAAKQGVKAEVKINPLPPHIAGNLMAFLQRVKCEGMEAVAWVEAYTFLQQHAPQAAPPQGVPFPGTPK